MDSSPISIECGIWDTPHNTEYEEPWRALLYGALLEWTSAAEKQWLCGISAALSNAYQLRAGAMTLAQKCSASPPACACTCR